MLVRDRGINNIKVSWIDPGQYGRFWGPFLVHWNASLTKIMNLKRFGYLVRQNMRDPGFISMLNVFPLIPVVPKPPQLPYGANKTIRRHPTVPALTKNKTLTCFVSEPDFRFSIFVFFAQYFCKFCWWDDKDVLDRPWTIWKVLKAISNTLKCHG